MGITTQDNDDANDANDDDTNERHRSNVDETDENSSFKRHQNDDLHFKRQNDNSSLKRRLSAKVDRNESDGLTFRLREIASKISKMLLSTFYPFASTIA